MSLHEQWKRKNRKEFCLFCAVCLLIFLGLGIYSSLNGKGPKELLQDFSLRQAGKASGKELVRGSNHRPLPQDRFFTAPVLPETLAVGGSETATPKALYDLHYTPSTAAVNPVGRGVPVYGTFIFEGEPRQVESFLFVVTTPDGTLLVSKPLQQVSPQWQPLAVPEGLSKYLPFLNRLEGWWAHCTTSDRVRYRFFFQETFPNDAAATYHFHLYGMEKNGTAFGVLSGSFVVR